MTASDLLEQPCNKSDNINKLVTTCQQVVPYLLTTWDKQCEHNLLTACRADLLQHVRFLPVYTRENLTICQQDVFATGL
jgi:hypothetical protein